MDLAAAQGGANEYGFFRMFEVYIHLYEFPFGPKRLPRMPLLIY